MRTDLEPRSLLINQAGKARTAGVGLQRDKDNIPLHEDMKQPESDLSVEERIFLEEFPVMKEELEVDLRRLRALADHIDTTHKIVTKTSVVANAFAVLSGAVSILGSALAPATAGGSLVLSVTGRVVGTRGEATSILAKILECFYNQEAQAQVGSLMPTCGQELWQAGPISVTAAKKVVQNCGRTIEMGICAFQVASALPRLATAAKRLLTTGQVSAQRSRQVQRVLEGVVQLVKANAPLLRMAMAGFYLSADLLSLLKDWKQLKEGAKTELAEELRVQARALERKLKELTPCFESLQQRKLSQEEKTLSSASEGIMGTVSQPPARRGEAGSQVTERTRQLSPGAAEGNTRGPGGGWARLAEEVAGRRSMGALRALLARECHCHLVEVGLSPPSFL
ncbi:apolipoprotein L6-like [Phacochoerus africanus]|uniref:apolipoprotein L6-like n=1 Tax=Phacochoerus africanus TaxID=41426 RepID=UPI001FD9051A|nr:apolipoprotein L6-like [Phacochoerus africanus]